MPVRLDTDSADFASRFKEFLAAKREVSADVERATRAIVEDVATRGDAALLEERLEVSMVAFTMDEADVQRVLLHPRAMIGSDGLAVATAGPLSEGRPHPRFYGTYPRVLGHYARDLGLLSQEQAIFRMTGRPAQRLGLRDRGLVRPGLVADLVVYDPASVAERSTFADPHHYPIGLPHVVVNGALAVRDGAHTGSKRGRVLRPTTSRS